MATCGHHKGSPQTQAARCLGGFSCISSKVVGVNCFNQAMSQLCAFSSPKLRSKSDIEVLRKLELKIWLKCRLSLPTRLPQSISKDNF